MDTGQRSSRHWRAWNSVQRGGDPPTLRAQVMGRLTHSDYQPGDSETPEAVAGYLAAPVSRVQHVMDKAVEQGFLKRWRSPSGRCVYRVTRAGGVERQRIDDLLLREE